MRWNLAMVGLGALVLGCGAKDGMGNDGTDSSGSGTGEEGTAGTAGDGDCRESDFGTVMIELQRSSAEMSSPFTGTAKIRAFLDYEDCLMSFYVQEHPEWQIDGVEGAPLFDAWANTCLCEGDYSQSIVDCSVGSYEQIINTEGAADVVRLVIEYELANDLIEGLHLPYGPLPTESFAGCSPLVRLSGASVQGLDANDNVIWQIASFDNAVARVGQGASIQIFVERSG